MDNPSFLDLFVGEEAFVNYYKDNKNKLDVDIKNKLTNEIEKMSVMEILTLVLKKSDKVVKTIKPATSEEYAFNSNRNYYEKAL